MSPYEMYPVPVIAIEEKPMAFRCVTCEKPYYLDRKKQPKFMGCQCVEPTPPAPEPVVEAKTNIERFWF